MVLKGYKVILFSTFEIILWHFCKGLSQILHSSGVFTSPGNVLSTVFSTSEE